MKKRISLLVLVILLCILGGTSKNDVTRASGVNTITIGKTVNGYLEGGREDYYSFTPSETGQLTITIKGKVPVGLTAAILDENDMTTYRTKTVDCNTETGYETIKYIVYVDPISYRLRISGANTSVSGEYTIKTSFKSLKQTNGANHSIDTACTIKNNKYSNGYLTIDDRKDYYKIKVKSGENLKFSVNCYSDSTVTVGVIKPSEDFVTYLGSAGFNKYTYDFDQSVSAGTYIIVISGDGGTMIEEGRSYSVITGNYVLTEKMKTISKKVMYVGKSYKLKVTRTPVDATETLKYTSSNKKVVTVSSAGKLMAKAKGTATITVKGVDTGIKKKVTITVKEIAVKKVQITTAAKSIYIGDSLKLKAKVTPSDATNSKVTWKSSDSSIATVNSTGTVKAKGKGSCTITAKAGGKKTTYKLKVKSIPVSSVSLNRQSATLTVGNTVTLKATVSPNNTANKSVRFTSSNTTVATVSSKGIVTAKAAGTCTITATAVDKKATCKIIVKEKVVTTPSEEPDVETITMESSIRLSVGDKKKLSITISPTDADASTLTWKSSDSAVVSVKNGTITCKKAGYATIIVKAPNGVTAMCTVYVSE